MRRPGKRDGEGVGGEGGRGDPSVSSSQSECRGGERQTESKVLRHFCILPVLFILRMWAIDALMEKIFIKYFNCSEALARNSSCSRPPGVKGKILINLRPSATVMSLRSHLGERKVNYRCVRSKQTIFSFSYVYGARRPPWLQEGTRLRSWLTAAKNKLRVRW